MNLTPSDERGPPNEGESWPENVNNNNNNNVQKQINVWHGA